MHNSEDSYLESYVTKFNGETPTPVIDVDVVEKNLIRAQAYMDSHGIQMRPHIKTHKSIILAKRQIELGAVGITCQKLGEAEVMVDAGIADILVSFPIVGSLKIARLMALARRAFMSVAVDSEEVAAAISKAAHEHKVDLSLLVECDTGGERCGVQSPDAAAQLALKITKMPSVLFKGIMTYPPKGQVENTAAFLSQAISIMRALGVEPKVISVGGTPDMYRAHELRLTEQGVIHEHRPGTYLFSDRYMVHNNVGGINECALRILATVVSRPTSNRAIIDAGSKTFSSDLMGFSDYGIILEYPDARIEKLSEEHGHVDVSACNKKPIIGEILTIIPNHACAVTNLSDCFLTTSSEHFSNSINVDARGKVT